MQRLPRLAELILAIALCALVAFWITRILRGDSLAVPPGVGPASGDGANQRLDGVLASARLFGSRPPGVLSDNVRALGVIADESGHGSVIVSIDGQAPKVYRVGDTLDGRLVAAIRADQIELESGGARQVFRLPPPQPSATGMTVMGTGPGAALPSPYAAPVTTPSGFGTPAAPPVYVQGYSPANGRTTPPPGTAPPGMPPAPRAPAPNTNQ